MLRGSGQAFDSRKSPFDSGPDVAPDWGIHVVRPTQTFAVRGPVQRVREIARLPLDYYRALGLYILSPFAGPASVFARPVGFQEAIRAWFEIGRAHV